MQQIIRNAGKTVTLTLPDELVGMDVRIVALPAEEYVPMAAEAGVVYGEVDVQVIEQQLADIQHKINRELVRDETSLRLQDLRLMEIELMDKIAPQKIGDDHWQLVKESMVQYALGPGSAVALDEAFKQIRARKRV